MEIICFKRSLWDTTGTPCYSFHTREIEGHMADIGMPYRYQPSG